MNISGVMQAAMYYARKSRRVKRKEKYDRFHTISLSSKTILSSSTVGTVVGTFANQKATAPIVYSIDIDGASGQFSINGSQLRVASALTIGNYGLQIKAVDAEDNIFLTGFLIKVV